jgi:mRNA-degrading endonuclease RelE of RelBE toxin-antitoxin system
MSINHDADEPQSDKSLKDRLSENERRLLVAQIEFVKNIPEWVLNPANHNQILQVLASLPSVFYTQRDLQELLSASIGSLPPELLNRYLSSLSGASEDEEKSIAATLNALDKKYANNLDEFVKIELSKIGPDGYKGSLLDGHNLDDVQHPNGPSVSRESTRVDPSQMTAGDNSLESLKQRYKAHSSETFERFVKTTAYHFEAFMQAIFHEKGLDGLWSDEFPTLGEEYARIRSGKIPKALAESLYTIFTDACNKASFEIFKACQSAEL